jgi:DNA-binding GntR family transcriptional regulator
LTTTIHIVYFWYTITTHTRTKVAHHAMATLLNKTAPRIKDGANGKQACAEDLRARILTLDIAPGESLDESELSARHGLSRTPLREVLQMLAGEGYLMLEPNRGARATSMDLAVMRAFFQTAPMIYAGAARLAADNRTTDQLNQLKDAQRAFRASIKAGDAAAASLNNHRFHHVIGEMADNAYLMPSLNRLLIDHTRLGQTFYRPGSPAERMLVLKAAEQHDAMIAAIEDHDCDSAASTHTGTLGS